MKTTTLLPIVALILTNLSAPADLIHHWALDETTGGTAADSVGSNVGTWQDGTDTNLTWEAGMIGNAAHLNDAGGGEVQHFDVGVLSSLTGSTQISISLWFNPDGETNYNGLFTSRTESNAGSWALAWEGGNRADFHTSGTGNQTDSASTLSAGNWYHVLAVWDNDTGNRTVYINGDPAGTGASVTGTFTAGSAFGGVGTWFIGTDKCCGDDRDFDGLIDDVAVFDSALTATDAATIYTAGLAGTNVVLALAPAADVDGDGLDDPWEDKHFGNNDGTATPAELALQDGDDDGLPADGDGLDNLAEQTAGTDPNVADTDGDGLNDGDEVSGAMNPYQVGALPGDPAGSAPGAPTNPLDDDSDNDTILDGEEVAAGTDGFITNPNLTDTDGDFMGDLYEVSNNLLGGLDPTNSTDDLLDLDGDGIDNIDEHDAIPQTRADKTDTDDDGYDDPVEDLFGSWDSITATGTDPTNPDSDGDGLLDGMENPDLAAHNPPSQYKTDPNIFDSDMDGFGDGEEVAAGSDPDDDTSTPPPPPGIVLRVDFENSIDPTGGLSPDDVITQAGWTGMAVGNAPSPTVPMLSETINGVGITVTAGGAGYFQGRANSTWNNMTGTSWNNMVEDVISARSGDGTVSLDFTGLDDAKQYTLTVWHNVSATDSASFASGFYAITPSVTTGTLVGTATNGQATNWDRTDGKTDADFINSVISFTSTGSSAEILLTSASAGQLLVMSGLKLEFPVSGSKPLITDTGFNFGGYFEVTVTGLDTAKSYVLKRSANLQDGFPFTAFGPFPATSTTMEVTDSALPAGDSYYRIEEAP